MGLNGKERKFLNDLKKISTIVFDNYCSATISSKVFLGVTFIW